MGCVTKAALSLAFTTILEIVLPQPTATLSDSIAQFWPTKSQLSSRKVSTRAALMVLP